MSTDITIIDYEETGEILWPIPGHYTITSYFGKRTAPTQGASTYHKGIDIAASQGNEFIAVSNGTITYVGFLGGRWIHNYTNGRKHGKRYNSIHILPL